MSRSVGGGEERTRKKSEGGSGIVGPSSPLSGVSIVLRWSMVVIPSDSSVPNGGQRGTHAVAQGVAEATTGGRRI